MNTSDKKIEIRDTRGGDWFWVNKLVLVSPYLTNGSKITYCCLAYFADNQTQSSHPSINTLAKLGSVNKATIIRGLKQLESYSFITTKRIEGRLNQYTLLKLIDSTPVAKCNQSQIRNAPVANKEPNNTNVSILNNNTLPEAPADWNLENKLKEMWTDPKRRDLNVIALWVQEMNLKPENAQQLSSLISRNVRAAKLLAGYQPDDIRATIKVLKNTEWLKKFTIETITKFIDQIVSNKKKSGPKIISYKEEVKPDGSRVMVALYSKSLED